jgi:uroporphyrinogen decarboxylase
VAGQPWHVLEESAMTHRERVLLALSRREPDRVPMDLGGSLASTIVGRAYPALRKELGLPLREAAESLHYASLAVIEEDVRQALGVDVVHAPNAFGTAGAVHILSDDSFVDEWGAQWRRPEGGHYYVERSPFANNATPAAVEQFAWPAPEQLVNTRGLAAEVQRLRAETDYAISLELRGRVMSIGQFLRGFENWMMDLASNRPFVDALLERTTDIQVRVNDILLAEVGHLADIVYTSDDLGGQEGPLMSPDCFTRLFRPHFARIWSHARRKTGAKLMHHCCGSIQPFIADFIALGVEALNPVQVSAARMAPARLKAEFGKDICFWGAVDTRHVMPRGSIADVRAEVQRRIGELGRGGGYVLAAVHNLQPEVPPANIVALYRAGSDFGRYPLRSP